MNTTPLVGFEHLKDKPKLLLDDQAEERTLQAIHDFTHEEVYLYPNWDRVYSYDEFVEYIKTHPMPVLISFDHDLADVHKHIMPPEDEYEQHEAWEAYHNQPEHEKTGYDCMKWLVEYCFDNKIVFPRVLIHAQNTVGYDNIKYYYRNALRNKMIKLR